MPSLIRIHIYAAVSVCLEGRDHHLLKEEGKSQPAAKEESGRRKRGCRGRKKEAESERENVGKKDQRSFDPINTHTCHCAQAPPLDVLPRPPTHTPCPIFDSQTGWLEVGVGHQTEVLLHFLFRLQPPGGRCRQNCTRRDVVAPAAPRVASSTSAERRGRSRGEAKQ